MSMKPSELHCGTTEPAFFRYSSSVIVPALRALGVLHEQWQGSGLSVLVCQSGRTDLRPAQAPSVASADCHWG
jgi:hypothetical protein